MAFVMSGFMTWVNTGFNPGFPLRWFQSFITAWPVALVCVMLIVKPIRNLVSKLTGQ